MQIFSRAFSPEFRLYLGGDFHIGSLMTHYDGIKQFVQMVDNDDDGYAIILGDLCEAICVDDKRFDPNTNDPNMTVPGLQYKKARELLEPISDKILFINDGNHDYKHYRVINMVKDLVCEPLKVPYGTYTSKLIVKDNKGKIHCKVFTGHGWMSLTSTADDPIREKSNLLLSLKRRLKNKAGDCVLMAIGHTHKLLCSEPIHRLYMVDNCSHLKQKYFNSDGPGDFIHPDHRFYVNTGSFLKNQVIGASGYAERAGYDPVELGYAIAHFENWQPVRVDLIRI